MTVGGQFVGIVCEFISKHVTQPRQNGVNMYRVVGANVCVVWKNRFDQIFSQNDLGSAMWWLCLGKFWPTCEYLSNNMWIPDTSNKTCLAMIVVWLPLTVFFSLQMSLWSKQYIFSLSCNTGDFSAYSSIIKNNMFPSTSKTIGLTSSKLVNVPCQRVSFGHRRKCEWLG